MAIMPPPNTANHDTGICDSRVVSEAERYEKASHQIYPPVVRFNSQVQELFAKLSQSTLEHDVRRLTSFHNRYFRASSGKAAALWIQQRLLSATPASRDARSTVELFQHGWKQPSVIARIQGVSNRTIILSAHIDSVNLYLPFFFAAPGADDDASGVAALLSVFDVLSTLPKPPANTLEFHFYAAEETGFWGSSAIFSSYNAHRRSVYSMLQFDMIGYTAGTTTAKEELSVGLVTDQSPKGLIRFLNLLVDSYLDVHATNTSCGYACSDHASAMRYGYSAMLVTGGKLEYLSSSLSHTASDTVQNIDFEHMMRFVKLGTAYAYELGYSNLDEVIGYTDDGSRAFLCDLGYMDGWMGSVRRFAAARAADPLGLGLWYLVALILVLITKPWTQVPFLMKAGSKAGWYFNKGRGKYSRVSERDD